jgi:hypothetical protein
MVNIWVVLLITWLYNLIKVKNIHQIMCTSLWVNGAPIFQEHENYIGNLLHVLMMKPQVYFQIL